MYVRNSSIKHMFACANYLVFEGILPAIHSFKGGDWLCLLQPGF
jgi:hypothetical protein